MLWEEQPGGSVRKRITGAIAAAGLSAAAWSVMPVHHLPAGAGASTYLQVDFVTSTTGFVLAERGSTFWLERTTDGGSTWSAKQVPFGVPSHPPNKPGEGIQTLHFLNGSHGWVLGLTGKHCVPEGDESKCAFSVFTTSNGGTSWQKIFHVSSSASIDAMAPTGTGTGLVVTSSCKGSSTTNRTCGYAQRTHSTSDGGRAWKIDRWNLGRITSFSWTSARAGWVAAEMPGQPNCAAGLYRTTNGGRSWRLMLHLPHECSLSFAFHGADGWAASATLAACNAGGCNEQLRATSNEGKSWHYLQSGSSWTGGDGFVEQVGLVDSHHGYLVFALGANLNTGGGIATSQDGGKTWTRSYPCYAVEPGGGSSPSPKELWLAGTWVSYCSQPRGSGLFTSTSWGAAWKQISP